MSAAGRTQNSYEGKLDPGLHRKDEEPASLQSFKSSVYKYLSKIAADTTSCLWEKAFLDVLFGP